MKKLMLYIFVLLLIFSTACTFSESDDTDEVIDDSTDTSEAEDGTTCEAYELEDYFPFWSDTYLIYEGTGNEYAGYTTYTEYVNENRIQTRSDNTGTQTVSVYEIKDGKLSRLMARSECYYREDFTNTTISEGEVLIQEPLEEGTQWILADGSVRYISGVGIELETDLGTYETLQITTDADTYTINDYYAPDVGLVKSVYYSDEYPEDKITSTLAEIQTETPMLQNIRFFYPDTNLDSLYYVHKQVPFYTNDSTSQVISEEYKVNPSSETATVLTENAFIQSLYLEQKDGILYADMSGSFVTEMNAGSGYEGLILQSITNTLGTYYNSDQVCLTVENEPYSSGHFLMEEGECFTVDVSMAEPLQ